MENLIKCNMYWGKKGKNSWGRGMPWQLWAGLLQLKTVKRVCWTPSRLQKVGLADNSECGKCHDTDGSLMHMLSRCPKIWEYCSAIYITLEKITILLCLSFCLFRATLLLCVIQIRHLLTGPQLLDQKRIIWKRDSTTVIFWVCHVHIMTAAVIYDIGDM